MFNQVEIYKVITKKLYRLMQKSNYVEMLTKVDSFEEMMSFIKDIRIRRLKLIFQMNLW